MKNGIEQINEEYSWELALICDRRGLRLVDRTREFIGAVFQSALNRGEWGFSDCNHRMGKWGFESENEAKTALLVDLGIE